MENMQENAWQDLAGIEVIGDLKQCDVAHLLAINVDHFRAHISALIQKYSLTELESVYHQFDVGFTGITALVESHLAVHTRPHERYVSANLFVCNCTRDNSKAASDLFDEIVGYFKPKDLTKHVIERRMKPQFPLSTREQEPQAHRSVRYLPLLEVAYSAYVPKIPLDLATQEDFVSIQHWREQYQLSKLAFTQMISRLIAAKNLDDFIKRSSADFDNLGPVIEAAVEVGVIQYDTKGKIQSLIMSPRPARKKRPKDIKVVPRADYNQFPCDTASRKRRAALIRERFPYVERLRFALIGDDDLVSTEFLQDDWAEPVVVEKDTSIIDMLRRLGPKFQLVEEDVRTLRRDNAPKVETFMTDAPYTLDGALAFITAGTKLLNIDGNEKEFYVILNPTMMGKKLLHMQQILTKAGIYLIEVRPNFSQYPLPESYGEKKRLEDFSQSHGLLPQTVNYSSSSNLYIFRTISPNIGELESSISSEKIYRHYS